MELICVRHGRTAWNADRRFQGQTDIPLDSEGLAQAKALGAHLRRETFNLAVTSDLGRAVSTARAICEGREIAIALEHDPGFREMHFGEWEGLTWAEIAARWPDVGSENGKGPRTYTAVGGESFDALGERIRAALLRVTSRLAPDGRALIVCHAGVLHAIAGVVLGRETEATAGLKFVPASILRVRGSFEDGWELTAINETADDRGSITPTTAK